jgi:hypothetical protein
VRYKFHEIEITRPLVALEFAAGETGAALLKAQRATDRLPHPGKRAQPDLVSRKVKPPGSEMS